MRFVQILKIAVLTAVFFLLNHPLHSQEADPRGYIVQVGDPAPDFTLEFPDGSTWASSDSNQEMVLLQFTASWCSVCREEMPHIEKKIWNVYKDKGLLLFGVDRDEPRETVVKFAQEMNISYPLALDPGAEIFSKFAIKESGVTRNVLIDRMGNIAYLTRLYDHQEFETLISVIDSLIHIED